MKPRTKEMKDKLLNNLFQEDRQQVIEDMLESANPLF